MILYQCDIDGKFTISLDKFLGPVQGINEPEKLPCISDVIGSFLSLPRKAPGMSGYILINPRLEYFVRSFICQRQW